VLKRTLTVLDVELDGRTIGRLAHPRIQILSFPCFKEQNIVAVVELGELVELVELCFCVEF
jgi:hypothetical protein